MMKHYHMEFEAKDIIFYSTEYYDNPHAVLDEVAYYSDDILEELGERSDYLHYDNGRDDNSPENQAAVSLFKSWMQQFRDSLTHCEMDGQFSVEHGDMAVYFCCGEVKSRFIPAKR